MKKEYFKIIGIALVCIMAVFLIWNLTDCAIVNAKGQTNTMSFIDSWQLRCYLLAESTGQPDHNCEFSRDYSIEIGSLTFYLSQDNCSTIYIPLVNRYCTITEENHEALHRLLSEYEPETF